MRYETGVRVPPTEVGGFMEPRTSVRGTRSTKGDALMVSEPPAPEPITLTLTLTPACVERLHEIVNRYNAPVMATQGPLSLRNWLHLHLRELAVQDELMEAANRLQSQAQADAQAAIKA